MAWLISFQGEARNSGSVATPESGLSRRTSAPAARVAPRTADSNRYGPSSAPNQWWRTAAKARPASMWPVLAAPTTSAATEHGSVGRVGDHEPGSAGPESTPTRAARNPCHIGPVIAGLLPGLLDEVVAALRAAGARFALLHGSRVTGRAVPGSDLDVAAWWADTPPTSFDVLLPPGVDLAVLNDPPLELAGRIALDGRVLFDDDPPARVRWVATTRKIYADEMPRLRRSHAEFAVAVRRGR